MKFIYVILMVIAWTLAKLETWDIPEIENRSVNLNKLVDRFNPSIVQLIRKYNFDPLKLSQTEQKLWTENLNISKSMIYKIDIILQSGILNGLSNLKRQNNATLTYANRLLKINIDFKFKLLQAKYNYVVKLIFRKLKGRLIISTENVRAVTNIRFDVTNYTLTLDEFDLQVPGRIMVIVENKNGSMDWINTAIVNIVTPFFKDTITSVIRERASNEIRTYFNEINHKIAPRKIKLAHILKYQLLNQNSI